MKIAPNNGAGKEVVNLQDRPQSTHVIAPDPAHSVCHPARKKLSGSVRARRREKIRGVHDYRCSPKCGQRAKLGLKNRSRLVVLSQPNSIARRWPFDGVNRQLSAVAEGDAANFAATSKSIVNGRSMFAAG